MRFIGLRHEASGPMMAAAVYRRLGPHGVALGEMGPGGLNLAAGAGRRLQQQPRRARGSPPTSIVPPSYPHSGMFMDLDTRALFAPLTKWNAVVNDPRRIPELVRRRFAKHSAAGPVRCTWTSPRTCWRRRAISPTTNSISRRRAIGRSSARVPQPRCVDAAAELLRGARRPLIVAGGGSCARRRNAELRETRAAAARAGGADPDGARRDRERQRRLHRPRRPDRRRAGRAASSKPTSILSIGCRYSSWLWDEHGRLPAAHQRLITSTSIRRRSAPVLHEVAHARRRAGSR